MTTLDGKTELDNVVILIGDDSDAKSISLQGVLELGKHNTDSIVDLRCATYKGKAEHGSLILIQVDNVKNAGI